MSWLDSPPQDDDATAADPAFVVDQDDLGVWDLGLPSLAAQLLHGLARVIETDHMCLRKIAAMRVERELATQLDASPFDKRPALADAAEAQVFEKAQNMEREPVVDLDSVDVLVGYAGHRERAL